MINMLVRVTITHTPLPRRATRLMIKLSVVLALVQLFGLTSLYAVAAYFIITRLSSRRTAVHLPYRKARALKKKSDRLAR